MAPLYAGPPDPGFSSHRSPVYTVRQKLRMYAGRATASYQWPPVNGTRGLWLCPRVSAQKSESGD